MSKSTRKGPFVHKGLLKRIKEMNVSGDKRVVKTWPGSSTIFPQMVGHIIVAHGGRKYVPVLVSEDMVGHRLGEFVLTKTYKGHDYDEKTTGKRK